MKETDTALVLSISPILLRELPEESGFDSKHLTLHSRFRIRDPQIEHIGWALKAETEQGYPNGSLYIDSLATALAMHLLRRYSSVTH